MVYAGVIFVVLGIAAYLLARRGRFVGGHPHCRKCGFNLFGLPHEHPRCPECGADILQDSGIRIGDRRPMLAGMVAAAFVAICGIGLLVAAVVVWWSTFDGSRFKTVAMLMTDLGSSRQTARVAARRELLRRADAGALSTAQGDQIATAIVAWQNDPAKTWDPVWGDIVQAERHSHTLSAELWRKYLQSAIHVTLAARPRVGISDPLPLTIRCALKVGSSGVALDQPTIHVLSAGKSSLLEAGAPQVGWSYPASDLEWDVTWARDLQAAGPANVKIQVTMTLDDHDGTHITTDTQNDVTYDVLPAGQSSVALDVAPTPEEQGEMADCLQWRLRTSENGKVPLGEPAAKGARSDVELGSLFVSGPPVAAAFRIVIRQGGREWTFARCLVRANDGEDTALRLPKSAFDSGLHAGRAVIVCVPEADLAAQTMDIMKIWGKEECLNVELVDGPR